MATGRLLSHGRGIAGPTGLDDRERAAVAWGVAAALAVTLACGGATLLLRRLTGGFAFTPGPAVAWAVTAAGWPLVMATDLAARLERDSWPRWLARVGLVAAALAVAPVGDGLSLPARVVAALAVTVALVVAIAPLAGAWPGVAPRPFWPGRAVPTAPEAPPRERHAPAAEIASLPAGLGGPSTPLTDPGRPPASGWTDPPPAGFRQRLERLETPSGEDCLRGQVLVAVPAGSRTGHAHVGFCPPFAGLPQLEVSTTCDVVEAEVVAAEILPWGVRIECRLSEPAEEPLEIPADFEARHSA
ncbi:MAG: hypothetical protein ACKOCX_06535 [Planctomycetota bacterium]